MNNRIKIIFNEEESSLGYLIQNDRYEWIGVSPTSKLSRHEYKCINLEDNAKKILDYISEVYAPGKEDTIEIVLEGFPYECSNFIATTNDYQKVKVYTKNINVLVCGKVQSGKTTLIQALTNDSECVKKAFCEVYKNNNISWYEVQGLDIAEGTFDNVINDLNQVLEEAEVTTVIYCASFEGHRIEKAEKELLEFIKEKNPEIRIIIAITRAIDEVACKEWALEIMKSFDGVKVTPVLAKNMSTRAGTVESYGLYTITNLIYEGL